MLQTSRRTLTIRGFIHARQHSPAYSRRTFALTAGSQAALSLHPSDISGGGYASIAHADRSSSERDDYVSIARRQKYDDLLDSLTREGANPNRTWAYYVDLLDFTRDEQLPLEIHQRVLRKCTPEAREIRTAYALRLRERRVLESPHRNEARFLTVINNIRRAGYTPTLDDYEFILVQFAAVGHYVGAAQVLQEIIKAGLKPRTKTFGLCLQAIAYRLTLPCAASQQAMLREQCSQLCLHVVGFIQKQKQRVPSACLDLTLRIMKDTDDANTFTSLLKIAYGIDLEYLDRHPLASDGALENPEPFSTAALTTLVDFLGRQKQFSKMVAAFEVLSAPLNVVSAEAQSRNFDDDDDDDGYFVPMNSSTPRPLPSAQPNTTTYNTLIRHCTHLHQTALAKHYVLQAMDLDYFSSARLQSDIQSLPLASIRPPELQINVDTFRPILGLGNRDNDLALIKWILPHFRMALRRKKQDLEYYSAILDRPDADIPQPAYPRSPGGLRSEYFLDGTSSESSIPAKDVDIDTSSDLKSEPPLTFFTPSSPSEPLHPTPALFDDQMQQNPLDVALDSSSSPAGARIKQFDLALHVNVLQRVVLAMNNLDERIGAALSRLNVRRKEALGRRVWEGKNVYVRNVDERVKVSREDWMEMVNFGGASPKPSSTTSPVIPEAQGDPATST